MISVISTSTPLPSKTENSSKGNLEYVFFLIEEETVSEALFLGMCLLLILKHRWME